MTCKNNNEHSLVLAITELSIKSRHILFLIIPFSYSNLFNDSKKLLQIGGCKRLWFNQM